MFFNFATEPTFLKQVYQDVILDLKLDKISDYFSAEYIQVFHTHMETVKSIVESILLSPFYDFLFDEEKQTATLRYEIHVKKKNGNSGVIEIIAIFELKDRKIIRCNKLTRSLQHDDEFNTIGKITTKK
ncbi:nuclear transport factor 2 family protein [Bacillus cereus]|nr:nuclear transport factor 2 family protein [Bacillus cereus]MBJ8037947.1 nuclear transport factor 2 family protein [Bacillus cereus]